jgi:hypothetical protein
MGILKQSLTKGLHLFQKGIMQNEETAVKTSKQRQAKRLYK